jgi:hypothetical protein
MRKTPHLLSGAILTGALLVSAALPAVAAGPTERAQARLAKALEGRVAGAPVDCIDMRSIQSSEIIDRSAIVYRMNNGKIYINTPRSGQRSLSRGDVMVTDTHSSQLCSIDIVRLYDSSTRSPTGFIGLDKFVPYTKVAAPRS